MRKVTIIIDGGCCPNPGPGGWGAFYNFWDGETMRRSGGEEATTNNRMELGAVLHALEVLSEPCDILFKTDSQLVVQYLTTTGAKSRNVFLMAIHEQIVRAVRQGGHKVRVLKVTDNETLIPHALAEAEYKKFVAKPLDMVLN